MANKSSDFAFTTLAQVEYFAKVGQLLASKNNVRKNIKIDKNKVGEILCVVINHNYYMYSDIVSAARKAWSIDEQKVKNIKYVCAVCNSTIVGVYELMGLETSAEEGKICLNLTIADIDKQEEFLGRTFDGKAINGSIFYM